MSRILIVDDEAVVRSLLRTVLEQDGHTVEEACDGNEAVQLHREDPAELVMIDLLMPNKHGLDTLIEMREFNPYTRFIIMTGALPALLEGDHNMDELLGRDVAKLTKPMTPANLLKKVREVLGTTTAP